MQDAFGTLVWIVAGVGAIVAIYTLIGTGRRYTEIGGGGLVRDGDERVDDGTGRSEEEELREEIRDHVVARNARRARSGDAPLDVEQEIERRIRDLS
jgi:hypothetical protein